MNRVTCWKLKGKRRVSRECGRWENGFSIHVCEMRGGEKWPVFFFTIPSVSSPSFWMFHKELRSLTSLLLPVGFVTEFDTLYQSVLFVVCFDNKTRGEVSYLIRLSSSVWRWIPKKCLDEWMDGWTKQKAQSSVRDWRTCLNNAQWWLT